MKSLPRICVYNAICVKPTLRHSGAHLPGGHIYGRFLDKPLRKGELRTSENTYSRQLGG